MNFGAVSGDIMILVFYIVLTIVLILFGKFVGKVAYGLYWDLDPSSYKSTYDDQVCSINALGQQKCEPKTDAQKATESRVRAEEDGRWVGAWMGFLIGGVLSVFKAYNIYVKMRTGA